MNIPTRTKNLLAASISFALVTGASAVTIGFGPDLFGVQDTQSNGKVVAVPEPSTSFLSLIAVVGFCGMRRRR